MMNRLSQNKSQTNAGILVVDNHRRIVSLNRKFLEMWRLPQQFIVSRDEDQALEFVSSQFEDPKSFLEDVRELNRQVNLEIHDSIKFKDGRLVERYSHPQWLEEKYIGRVWICRELTEVRYLNELNLTGSKILRVPNIYKTR